MSRDGRKCTLPNMAIGLDSMRHAQGAGHYHWCFRCWQQLRKVVPQFWLGFLTVLSTVPDIVLRVNHTV